MEFLTEVTAYHWFALGLILLTAEVLGTAGFLLGAGIAALGMGVVVALFPSLAVGTQVLLYVLSSAVATAVYFKMFRDDQSAQNVRPFLNKRASRLIGHRFELQDDINLGVTKVQIGDTLWRVKSDVPLTKGTSVEVVSAGRMSLVIAPVNTATAPSI